MKNIPYGISNFEKVITGNYYYIDKTKYIEILESYGSPYLFFLRPRRFGKSLFVSALAHYYDINRKDDFERIFGKTYIGKNPTPLRNSYPVLHFNFSMVKTIGSIDDIQDSFAQYLKNAILSFANNYKELFKISDERIDSYQNKKPDVDIVRDFIMELSIRNIPIFLIIDEYDNFANNILAEHGSQTYMAATHAGGFLRSFFANLKGLTDNREIDRMFITGVSPLVMADVTSGFNIGDNISQDLQLSAMAGINPAELEEMVDYYVQTGIFTQTKEYILRDFKMWYNGYAFNRNLDKIYNTVSVLYYINYCIKNRVNPIELIDENMRTDYGKFRFLLTENNKLNGNFSVLRQILEKNETSGMFVRSFSVGDLISVNEFKSLLYYLGFTTLSNFSLIGEYTYTIPNKLIRKLLWGFVQKSITEVYDLRINRDLLINAFTDMALRGNWKPAFEYIIQRFYDAVSLRDFVFHEEGIKTFMLAWLNMAVYYKIYSEKELEQGYSDIFIEPEPRYGDAIKFAYIIELKYLKADLLKNKAKAQTATDAAVKQANAQLQKFAEYEGYTTKKLIIVASAKKLLYLGEV